MGVFDVFLDERAQKCKSSAFTQLEKFSNILPAAIFRRKENKPVMIVRKDSSIDTEPHYGNFSFVLLTYFVLYGVFARSECRLLPVAILIFLTNR